MPKGSVLDCLACLCEWNYPRSHQQLLRHCRVAVAYASANTQEEKLESVLWFHVPATTMDVVPEAKQNLELNTASSMFVISWSHGWKISEKLLELNTVIDFAACGHAWKNFGEDLLLFFWRTIGTTSVSSLSRQPLWLLCWRGLSLMRTGHQASSCGLGLTPHLKMFCRVKYI